MNLLFFLTFFFVSSYTGYSDVTIGEKKKKKSFPFRRKQKHEKTRIHWKSSRWVQRSVLQRPCCIVLEKVKATKVLLRSRTYIVLRRDFRRFVSRVVQTIACFWLSRLSSISLLLFFCGNRRKTHSSFTRRV